MINRTLIRIKTLQVLYNYYKTDNKTVESATHLLEYALDSSYQLYIYLTGLPIELSQAAEEKKAREMEKFQPDREAVLLLQHFIQNPLLDHITADSDYMELWTEARLKLRVGNTLEEYYEQVLNQIIKSCKEQPIVWDSYDEVRKLWRQVYGETLKSDALFQDLLQERNTFLNDDIEIIFSFVTKVFNATTDDAPYSSKIRPAYSDEEDRLFGHGLLHQAITYGSEYRDLISKYFKNWDRDRVSEIDYLILQLAVAETKRFPTIATTVTINEYLNLAHAYSAPHSYSFINGILHELFKDIKEHKVH